MAHIGRSSHQYRRQSIASSSQFAESIKATENANKRLGKQLQENNNTTAMRPHTDSITTAMQNDAIFKPFRIKKSIIFNNK